MPRIRGPAVPQPEGEIAVAKKQDEEVIDNGPTHLVVAGVARPLSRGANGRKKAQLADAAVACSADKKVSKLASSREAKAVATPAASKASSPKEDLFLSMLPSVDKADNMMPIDLSTPEKEEATTAREGTAGLVQRRRGRPRQSVDGERNQLKQGENEASKISGEAIPLSEASQSPVAASTSSAAQRRSLPAKRRRTSVAKAEQPEPTATELSSACAFAVGEKVLADYKAAGDRFPAVILKVHSDGKFLLDWEDGDKEDRIKSAEQLSRAGDEFTIEAKQAVVDPGLVPAASAVVSTNVAKQPSHLKRTLTGSSKKATKSQECKDPVIALSSAADPSLPVKRTLTSRFRLKKKMINPADEEQLATDHPKLPKRKLILTEKGKPLKEKPPSTCSQAAPRNKLMDMLKRNKRTEAAKLLDMLKRRAATSCPKPRIELRCTLGHILEKAIVSDGDVHTCATCQMQLVAGANSWACRPCNHDVCESCKAKAEDSKDEGPADARSKTGSDKRTIVMPIESIGFLQQVRARMRSTPPLLGGDGGALALAGAQRQRQHQDASLLGVFRERLLAGGGLSEPVQRALRQSPKLSAQLATWQAEAQEMREAEALAAVQEEEPEDAGADGVEGAEGAEGVDGAEGAGDEDGAAEGAAHRALLDAIAERHPRSRPRQCLDKLRQMRVAGQDDGDEYACLFQDHRDASLIAYLQRSFVSGSIGAESCATRRALHQLPEVWSLPMMLAWQRQLLAKIERIAEAHPKELPSSVNSAGVKEEQQREYRRKSCAEWINEFRLRAESKLGLDPHVSEELRRWFPWAEAALEEWGTVSAMKASKKKSNEGTPQVSALDRLKALTAAYPDQPPKRHIYTMSAEEENERKDAWALVRLEKAFFVGALKTEAMQELCERCEWLRNAAQEWEGNRIAGLDPDDTAIIQRLHEIAQRSPQRPPSMKCVMANASPEMRLLYSDTGYFRRLKERFLDRGLPQIVLDAILAIPIWGSPRLGEWEEQKQQRSQDLWAKRTPAAKTSCEDGLGEDEPTDAKRRRVESTTTVAAASGILRDSDVLVVSGAEPKFHKIRLRAAACHGKTVGEALASVLDGLMPLSRSRILGDIRNGVLKVEGSPELSSGESADATGEPLTTPPPKQHGRSAAGGKSSSKRKHGEEVFRKLDGTIGTLIAFKAEVKERAPLTKLTLGEIDRMSVDDLAHYEKHLGLSARRSLQERVSIVESLNQKSKIQAFAKKHSDAEDQDCPTSKAPAAKQFHELSEYERNMLSQSELEYFESRAALSDVGLLSLEDRRRRLKEQHHSQSQQELSKGGVTGRLDTFFKMAGTPKKLDAMLVMDSPEAAPESASTASPEEALSEQPCAAHDVEPAMAGSTAADASSEAPPQAVPEASTEAMAGSTAADTSSEAPPQAVPEASMEAVPVDEVMPDEAQEPQNGPMADCPPAKEDPIENERAKDEEEERSCEDAAPCTPAD